MLDKFWAVPTVRSWFSRGWISFKVVAAVGTREGLQAVRNHRVAPEVLVQQVALRLQMRVQSGDCGVGPAREHELEERYVAGLASGQTGGHVLCRLQGHPRRRYLAFAHQYLGLASMGQGETGIGGDGAVKGLDRAGIEGKRKITALNVGVPRSGVDSGQRKVVSVRQHGWILQANFVENLPPSQALTKGARRSHGRDGDAVAIIPPIIEVPSRSRERRQPSPSGPRRY